MAVAGVAHSRVVLTRMCMERRLSKGATSQISRLIKNSGDDENHKAREKMAAKIINIIQESKTETEIVEKLEAMK